MSNCYTFFNFKQIFNSVLKALILFLAFGIFSSAQKAHAQTLNAETTVPVLTACGNPGVVTLIIEKGSTACNTGELKIDLPEGFEYVSGTLKIDGATHPPEATSNASGLDVKLPICLSLLELQK